MRDIEEFPDNFIQKLHMQIGQNIKKARENANITQLQLSQ